MFFQPDTPPERIFFDDGSLAFELRRSRVEETQALLAAIEASLSELRAFMPWSHFPQSIGAQEERVATLREQWDGGTDFVWNIVLPIDGVEQVAGCVGLHPRCLNPLGREVGYWVRSDLAGRGLCTAVSRTVVLAVFEGMGLERLQVGCDVANLGSRRVIEKTGFVFEATLDNMLESAPPEAVEAGWRGTGAMRLYRLIPADIPTLSWRPALRPCVRW